MFSRARRAIRRMTMPGRSQARNSATMARSGSGVSGGSGGAGGNQG